MANHNTGWLKTKINGVLTKVFAISHVKSTYYDYANNKMLSTKLGEMDKATSDHAGNKENPHGVTKAQVGLGNVDNTSDANKPISNATQQALNEKAETSVLTAHTDNKENPHGVTKTQVGLGNVPNVATNNQTPTYTEASTLTALTSGEKMSVAFGKIAKAISDFISHLTNKNNPHGVTTTQLGAATKTEFDNLVAGLGESNDLTYTEHEDYVTGDPPEIDHVVQNAINEVEDKVDDVRNDLGVINEKLTDLEDAIDNVSIDGMLGGKVIANNTAVTALGEKQVRNIYAGTEDLVAGESPLASGDIYIVYE